MEVSGRKRILIVNCYLDELRIALRRQNKVPHQMIIAFLAGLFSPELCDIRLYDEVYSGPLEDETLLAFPDMMVLTGLNTAFDRMLHLTAYVRTKNKKTVIVAGGSAIRALRNYAKQFFDYCCTGDIEQLHEVIVKELGEEYVAPSFLEKGWVIPRYDLTYWIKPHIITYVESSRNCYFNCNFCSITAENGKYQAYDIEYLREQLDGQFSVYGKQGVVHFIDNTFASFDRNHLFDRFALLKELWQEGYFRRWSALVTSDFFFRDENLELALDSGCMALFSGVETFDNKALLDFRKTQNTRLPQEEIIRKCLNAGIAFLYGLVFDLTSRPIAELRKELDFIVGNHEITLPSFVSVAVPLLKSPFFYDCLDRKLFLPNVKLRDMDSTTLVLRPLDDISDAVQFVKDVQNLNGYRLRVARHIKNFYASYKNKLSRGKMILAQSNGFLLCTPKLLTATSDLGRLILNDSPRPSRTFVGSTELPDRVYYPAFPVDPRYEHYFLPTMLTDKDGNISEALHEDLLPTDVSEAA
jgi:hopanoid C-2 methylase